MVRKVTQAKFAEWAKDEANVRGVLELVATGTTLHKAAVVVKQPYMCLYPLFHNGGAFEEDYKVARRAWADARKDMAIAIAEDVKADRDHVAKAKLQIDTIDNQAKAYHRERWGERVQVEQTLNVGVDVGLVGTMGELLLKRKPALEDKGRVIEAEALPAPKEKADG